MQEQDLSKNNFEQCIKCTICTAYCPVVQVNPSYPGPKQAGPDGERFRLRNPFGQVDPAAHLSDLRPGWCSGNTDAIDFRHFVARMRQAVCQLAIIRDEQ